MNTKPEPSPDGLKVPVLYSYINICLFYSPHIQWSVTSKTLQFDHYPCFFLKKFCKPELPETHSELCSYELSSVFVFFLL